MFYVLCVHCVALYLALCVALYVVHCVALCVVLCVALCVAICCASFGGVYEDLSVLMDDFTDANQAWKKEYYQIVWTMIKCAKHMA